MATTPSQPDLAGVARALADESRATMAVALLDDRAWTAGELAAYAGIARSTASAHLDQLVAVGLVSELRQGRHRYLRLTDASVADAIEALAQLSGRERPAAPNLSSQRVDAELRAGRTCYRHLAGALGLHLTEEWRRLGVVTEAWELTADGREWLSSLEVPDLGDTRRALVRPCLDWT
ncbi:ArsR/SmtB family transcription factor [Mariniluteicoccus flavus]